MNDTQLGDWMRSLPRAKASPGFTSEVMREARRDQKIARRVPFVWRMATAMAMTACLVLVVTIAVVQHQRQQNFEVLRAEQERLEADLAAVKKIAAESEPMVVLENDRGTRVIMDLDTSIQPASLRTFD